MKEKREFNFAERWIDGLAREKESPSKLKTKVIVDNFTGSQVNRTDDYMESTQKLNIKFK